jgi:hypothetical protein
MANAKVKELFKDSEFVKAFVEAKNAEEAQKLIKSKGVDVTTEEIYSIQATLVKYAARELNEGELASVAAGKNIFVGRPDRLPTDLPINIDGLGDDELASVTGGLSIDGLPEDDDIWDGFKNAGLIVSDLPITRLISSSGANTAYNWQYRG